MRRKIVASGSIRIKDDEPFSDDYGTLDFTSSAVVSTAQPSVKLVNTSKCVGGEVRVELDLDAQLEDSGDVRVKGEARLFEGTSCSSNDLEDTQDISLTIPKDGSTQIDVRVESTGSGGGDYGKGQVSFTNTGLPETDSGDNTEGTSFFSRNSKGGRTLIPRHRDQLETILRAQLGDNFEGIFTSEEARLKILQDVAEAVEDSSISDSKGRFDRWKCARCVAINLSLGVAIAYAVAQFGPAAPGVVKFIASAFNLSTATAETIVILVKGGGSGAMVAKKLCKDC